MKRSWRSRPVFSAASVEKGPRARKDETVKNCKFGLAAGHPGAPREGKKYAHAEANAPRKHTRPVWPPRVKKKKERARLPGGGGSRLAVKRFPAPRGGRNDLTALKTGGGSGCSKLNITAAKGAAKRGGCKKPICPKKVGGCGPPPGRWGGQTTPF